MFEKGQFFFYSISYKPYELLSNQGPSEAILKVDPLSAN